MLRALLNSEQSVSSAQLDVGKYREEVKERLPVFNPREDWNEWLTTIVKDYELPNVGRAEFTSTTKGDLSKSKIVKLFALAGSPRQFNLGHGKERKVIKRVMPAHIGSVTVSDPVTKQEVTDILVFISEGLGISFPQIPSAPSGKLQNK